MADLPRTFADHRVPILGQVSVGSLVTDLLRGLGVVPDAAIGYSLGETAALVALGAWNNRDEIAEPATVVAAVPDRIGRSLRGRPPGLGDPRRRAGRLGCRYRHAAPEDAVREAIAGKSRVYILITNTARETVIGGYRRAVDEVVNALAVPIHRTAHRQHRALRDRPCGRS